jgi:negative regulator of flagellin synthesis FlgM
MSRELQFRFYETVVLRYNLPVGNRAAGETPSRAVVPPSSQEEGTDMDVRGVGSTFGSVPVRSPAGAPVGRDAAVGKPVSPNDELEISAAGKMLDQLSQNPDIRQERLARIKAAIEDGTYDTDAKLEAALSKMFDAMGIDFDSDLE